MKTSWTVSISTTANDLLTIRTVDVEQDNECEVELWGSRGSNIKYKAARKVPVPFFLPATLVCSFGWF